MNTSEKDSVDTARSQFVMASQACAAVEEYTKVGQFFNAGMVFQQARERIDAGLQHLEDALSPVRGK